MAATESSRVVAPSLAKRLGVEVNIAHGLIDRMEKEGFVKNSGKGRRWELRSFIIKNFV